MVIVFELTDECDSILSFVFIESRHVQIINEINQSELAFGSEVITRFLFKLAQQN